MKRIYETTVVILFIALVFLVGLTKRETWPTQNPPYEEVALDRHEARTAIRKCLKNKGNASVGHVLAGDLSMYTITCEVSE